MQESDDTIVFQVIATKIYDEIASLRSMCSNGMPEHLAQKTFAYLGLQAWSLKIFKETLQENWSFLVSKNANGRVKRTNPPWHEKDHPRSKSGKFIRKEQEK